MFKAFLSVAASLALLVGLSSDVSAGASGGPRYAAAVVFPQRYFAHKVFFEGDEQASIIVRGDGSTDLDCYVFDSAEDLIASDTDGTDYFIMRWYPYSTDLYTLQVVNRGYVSNRYVVRTN